MTFFQLNGRRVPLELKLLHSVQNVEGVIKLLDFFERPDSFIFDQQTNVWFLPPW